MSQATGDPFEGQEKYRALSELGRGGMGEVYLCEHVALGAKCVVKFLHVSLAAKAAVVDRMRLEAQALARLNHPHLVRVTDLDRTPSGRPYFVMEYLPGRSLRDEVTARGGWLPVPEAIELSRQALAGLGAAHRAGLVHRDVKLENLFVCEPAEDPGSSAGAAARSTGGAGRPRILKILDFGVAKVLHDAGGAAPAPLAVPTATGVVIGTPRFLAPEQARGKKTDHRADIYAMGLVTYALLAGRGPFDEARSIAEMAKAHVLTPPAPPSRYAPQPIPPALDAAVLRALAKDPDARYPSAEDFSAELERVRAALSTPAADAPAVATAPTAALPAAPLAPNVPPLSALADPRSGLAAEPAPTAPAAPAALAVPTTGAWNAASDPHSLVTSIPGESARVNAGLAVFVILCASMLGAATGVAALYLW
jgi:serine/threonine-protein kinase